MAGNNLLNRYIWIINTIRRYGKITRTELSDLWKGSPISEGKPLPRRTFYNYREGIQDIFGIEVKLDTTTNEYYISADNNPHAESIMSWMIDSVSVSNMLRDSGDVTNRIFMENVPSAHEHLSVFIDAIKHSRKVTFNYNPFNHSRGSNSVTIEPYLLKLFRQRWYVTGRNTAENKIKTYALDRVNKSRVTKSEFVMAPDFDPEQYFANSFGIVVDKSEPKIVSIMTTPTQAKYLRALPLHHSQEEMVHDKFSVFYYKIQLTPDFVNELLSMGPRITVLSPPELRTILTTSLTETLRLYKKHPGKIAHKIGAVEPENESENPESVRES